MGWSLDYQPPKEQVLLNQLFLAVGKSLYLASEFEDKCQWVLGMVTLTNRYESTHDFSASTELARVVMKKMLGPTIQDLKKLPEFTAKDLATVGTGQFGTGQVGTGQVGTTQVGTTQVGTG